MNCICLNCNKKFHLKPSAIKRGRGKYCSKICFNKSKIGHIAWNKGLPRTWESGRPFTKGQEAWNKGKHNYWQMGDKNPNWRGGVAEKNRDKRSQEISTLEYKIWRRKVFERDNYTCIECGSSKSGTLQADHIKQWALYPELRYKISNGRTLCIDCHRKTFIFMGNQFTTATNAVAPTNAVVATFLYK